jgi:hypothetical protein
MKNILINHEFSKSIQKLRSVLPTLSFALLITTYIISAIIMGIFHAQNAPNIGFTIAAFLVPIAIQAGRGTLVFFFQLNPARIQGRLSFGLVAATVMLILSLVEAYFVMVPYGITWIISVSALMIIGYVIEIMILKETIFATQIELFQDKEKWEEIKGFYIAQTELQKFLGELKKGNFSPSPVNSEKIEFDPLPEENKAISLLEELNHHLEGKVHSPSLNGQKKG